MTMLKKGAKRMNLESLVGKHTFSGVDYAEHGVIFCLDGVTYLAEEDEDDGYRSCMKELSVYSGKCRNTFPPQDVFCEYSEDEGMDVLAIKDFKTSKTILKIGTDYTESYYPYFVSEYKPENMSINASEESKAAESALKNKRTERWAKVWSAKNRIGQLEDLLFAAQLKIEEAEKRARDAEAKLGFIGTYTRKPDGQMSAKLPRNVKLADLTDVCELSGLFNYDRDTEFTELDAIKELCRRPMFIQAETNKCYCIITQNTLYFLLNEIKNLRRVTKLNGGKRMTARQTIDDLLDQLDGTMFHITHTAADIKRYNKCIDGMIEGKSPCPWCEDYKECQLQAKTDGKGCELWMLSFPDGPTPDGEPAPDGEKGAE